MSAALLLLPALALAAPEATGPERALQAELARAMTELRQPGYAPPYFVSLTASDVETSERRCAMGAPAASSSFRQRLLTPDLRVGDYGFDNHPVSPPSGFMGAAATVQDDEFALRHVLWLALDSSYKNASADYLRKKALRVQRGKTEYDTDDLSREDARTRAAEAPEIQWPAGLLESLCERGSAQFRRSPGLLEASASVRRRRVWSRLRTSEGTRVDHGFETAELELSAVDISTDGLRLYASRRFAAAAPAGLPRADEVALQARAMISDLEALKVAKTTSPFGAPALLDPSVSAAVVLAFGLRLSGEEQRDPGGAQIFRGKLGRRVLPAEFSLVDDPTLGSYGGTPLIGAYDFDDQGVPPSRVTLIENGLLKGFLLSRYPVIGFSRSNGHGRAQPGYPPVGLPGSLFLTSKRPLGRDELLERLRAEALRRGKPYGLWVKTLRHFVQQEGTGGHGSIRLMPELVYLVDAKTGALTLVRDLDLVGTPLDLMNGMLAAGDDASVRNISWSVPVSVVTPSLLLDDAELQRAETRPEKAPLLPPPPVQAFERKPVPTFAVAPYIEVVRYRVPGCKTPVPPFAMVGLLAMRSHGEGDDAVIEAKLGGTSLGDLSRTVQSMTKFVEMLAGGAKVGQEVVSPAMLKSAYEALHGSGWPDDKP